VKSFETEDTEKGKSGRKRKPRDSAGEAENLPPLFRSLRAKEIRAGGRYRGKRKGKIKYNSNGKRAGGTPALQRQNQRQPL